MRGIRSFKTPSLIALWVLAAAMLVSATPIEPNPKELLTAPPPQNQTYFPARAGWDGPETTPPPANALGMATRAAGWQAMRWIVLPDPFGLAAVALAIIGLRMLRRRRELRGVMVEFPVTAERKAA